MLDRVSTAETLHEPHHDAGSSTVLGFWFYLMSDCILFASVFAAYVLLAPATAGGPTPKEIFDLPYVAVETGFLLVSSFTYGLAMIALERDQKEIVLRWLGVTFLLGLGFIGMEIHEFTGLIAEGAGPDRSAFLTGFFTLVGTHGAHVTAGLCWMALMMAQVVQRGLSDTTRTRLMCLSLFWHFLDVIWIGVFTVVYLRGAM